MPALAPAAKPREQHAAQTAAAAPAAPAPALANGAAAGTPLFLLPREARAAVPIATTLSVNDPDDSFEREANAVARSAVDGSAAAPALTRADGAPRAAEPAIRPPDSGVPLAEAVRERVEPLVARDLSDVRVHQSADARDTARALGARAFTHAHHIWLGPDERADDMSLMAHEAAHVVHQQGGSGEAPAVQRLGGALDERLNQEFERWRDAVDRFEADRLWADAAYANRIVLMLQGVDGDTFGDESALEMFLDDVEYDALDEVATLNRTGEWALQATRAFPLIWAGRVWDALHLEADMAALEGERLQKQAAMLATAERVPGEVGLAGLPVPYAQAVSLVSFHLALPHVNLDRDHVVKDMALAARAYMAAGWVGWFYGVWNAMADSYAERVASGEVEVDLEDYTEFVETRRHGLDALAARLSTVEMDEALGDFDARVLDVTNAAFVAGLVALLMVFISARFFWEESSTVFDEKLAELDAEIAGEEADAKITRAFLWAYENGYFGAAAAEIWNAILAQGWKILGMAALFIVLQFVPIVNVVLDVILLIYAGVEVVTALYALYETFAAVAAATTAVGLQRESARMASSLEGNGLRALLSVIAITAALRGIKVKVDALRKSGLTEEEALRRALSEATSEEAAALRGGLARQRIAARFDPDGILTGVLDRGVNPEVVEQALLSGMSPQRLQTLVAAVTDASRAESIIAFAGNHSVYVNRFLDAGLPIARVGELADLGLGLRHLRACDLVLARTGQIAEVENVVAMFGGSESLVAFVENQFVYVNEFLEAGLPMARVGEMADLGLGAGHLRACELVLARTGQVGQLEELIAMFGEVGAETTSQLLRLTPEGLASVYQAGGRTAVRAVVDTMAMEQAGTIAGFGDWVEFTIVRMNKQGQDLLNAIGELREAQRIARTLSGGQRVRVGGDVRAVRGRVSFDMVVEDASGNALRNVEVTTVTDPLTRYTELTAGIKHAIDKVPAAAAGSREATIRVTIGSRFSLGRGRVRVINRDGTFHTIEKSGAIHGRGDILQDTADNLPSIAGSDQLTRVNVVNVDDSVVGAIENRAGTWVVVR